MTQRKKRLSTSLQPPAHDAALLIRVRYLVWVESLISLGCAFGPDDLPPQVWDQLLVLNIERAFVDRLVEQHREKDQHEQAGLSKARAQTGVPAPGSTLFTHTRPFK